MSISEMLHYYNVGQLIFQSTGRLKTGLQVLENKIEYMRKVAKQGSVAPQVYEDIRKYEQVHKEVKKCLETKAEVEAETLCGMLKEAAGEGLMIIEDHNQFPHDYSII